MPYPTPHFNDQLDDKILIPSLSQQLGLGMELGSEPDSNGAYYSAPEIDLYLRQDPHIFEFR